MLKMQISQNFSDSGRIEIFNFLAPKKDMNFIDLDCCIGSLEYFKQKFVQQTLKEIHRIMKSNGKFVLDIPRVGSKEFEITAVIEEYLGRKDTFGMSVLEFERFVMSYFIIVKKEIVGPMIQYFLICKK